MTIIPEVITAEWLFNILIALILGVIAGKLLKTAIWLAILVIVAFLVIQMVFVTPIINPESVSKDLTELGQNFMEWFKSIIPYFKEHLIANSAMFFAFIAGFIISFFIGKAD